MDWISARVRNDPSLNVKSGPACRGRTRRKATIASNGQKKLLVRATLTMHPRRNLSVLDCLMRTCNMSGLVEKAISLMLKCREGSKKLGEGHVNSETRSKPKNARQKAALIQRASPVALEAEVNLKMVCRWCKDIGILGGRGGSVMAWCLWMPLNISRSLSSVKGEASNPSIVFTNCIPAKCTLIVDARKRVARLTT